MATSIVSIKNIAKVRTQKDSLYESFEDVYYKNGDTFNISKVYPTSFTNLIDTCDEIDVSITNIVWGNYLHPQMLATSTFDYISLIASDNYQNFFEANFTFNDRTVSRIAGGYIVRNYNFSVSGDPDTYNPLFDFTFSAVGYEVTPAHIARYTYSLRYNDSVKVYKGLPINSSTFANVDLVYKYDKSFDNGTTWVAQEGGAYITKQSPIDYTKISPSVVNSTNATVFSYSFTDINGATKVLDTSSITPIDLYANSNKFSITPTNLYAKGETITLSSVLSDLVANGKLKFADGVGEVAISSVELASGYSAHKIEFVYNGTYFNNKTSVYVDDDTPSSFDIKLTLYTKYYGTLEYTYTVNVVGSTADYVVSATLSSYKSAFIYNDRVIFGESAELKTYNNANVLLNTYTGHTAIMGFFNSNNYKGSFIGANQLTMGDSGTIINIANHSTFGFLSDGAKTIIHKFGNKQVNQVIYVSYAQDSLLLTSSSTSTGTSQNRLIVPSAGLTLSTIGFKAEVQYRNNSSSGVIVTYIDKTSTVTWSKTAISYAEAITNSNVGMRILISGTHEGKMVSAYMDVYVTYRKPIAISITGVDSVPYYIGRTTKFSIPNFTNETEFATYRKEFNDDTYEDLSAQEIADLTYRASASTSSSVLVANSSDIASAITTLYACLEVAITESITEYIFGAYALNRVADAISSLEILNDMTFVLGNPYSAFKGVSGGFVIKAIYASGTIDNNFLNYTFNSSDGTLKSGVRYIMSADDIPSGGIIVYADNQTFTLAKSKITTFTAPAVEDVEVITNGLPLAYNNGTDKINVSNVQLLVSFVNALYTQIITFNANNSASTTEYSVQAQKKADHTAILESVNYYNGTDFVDVSGLTDALYCKFVFSFNNRFIPENTCTIGQLDFVIAAIQEIKSIIISNPYTDYVVGDFFLNDNDTTEAIISYRDGAEVARSMTIKLNSGFPSLAIMPQKGTIWSNIDNSKTIKVSSVLDQTIYAEYAISVAPRGYITTTRVHDLVLVWQENLILPDSTDFTTDYGVLVFVKEEYTEIVEGARVLKSGLAIGYSIGEVKPYGYLDDVFDEYATCKVVEFQDWLSPIEGSPNQTINFPSYRDGASDLINKCRIGILFGSNNATNRLFLSGNEDVPNADWHSSEINTTNVDGEILKTNGDFSYFTNESIMYYGETDNRVIGYDIVSNDRLLVLKDKSDKEKTVYFRAPTLLRAMDASGNVMTDINGETLYQEEYSLIKGNNSNAGISPHTILNFNGDTLFIDADKQLVGLDVGGIVGDNQRYANTRSRFIDNRLAKLDLSNAKLWSNNKYLFLSIPNYGLLVTHFTAKDGDQYEWWYLTSHNPSCFIELDGDIYFGNDNGVFGKLFNGIYQDVERVFVGKAQSLLATINPLDSNSTIDGKLVPQNSVVIDMNLMAELSAEKVYTFKVIAEGDYYGSHIFYQIAKMHNVKQSDTDLFIDETNNVIEIVGMVNGVESSERKLAIIQKINEGDVYYLNYLAGTSSEIIKIDADGSSPFTNFGDKYKFVYVANPTGNDYFTMKKGIVDNGVLTFSDVSVVGLNNAGLCKRLDQECDIVDLDHTNYSFRLQLDNEYLDLVKYGDQVQYRNFQAEISEWKNVESYYITAPMVMGNLNNFKTIWGFTLTNDTDLASELYVAYASNKIPSSNVKILANVSKDGLMLDFDSLNFSKVDFDKAVVPRTYTIHRVLGYQKFICFGFKNSNNTNAVLSAMSVTYTIPHPSYGSD